jgi:DNA-binding PadR family transcriptional regulator
MPMTRQPLTTEHILLGYLAERPMHGYELHQRLEDPTALGTVWRVKQAQLYALLGKLEGESLVEVTEETQDGKARRVLHLTAAGRETLDQWLRSPVPHGRELRIEFLAKLYFAQRRGNGTAQTLIEAQRRQLEQWLDEHPAPPRAETYRHLVHAFRAGQIRAMIEWLAACEATLEL